ncbi:MAG TPA: molybdenum cofactor guanylyltransferase MobA [Roseiarcus sp.]|jgi:molybdopterin-guanine dinucleotide biosynthesis protein A
MSEASAGVVLAGGRSTRMGAEKALLALGDRPLIAHVAMRLRPQVGALFINANGDAARFAALNCVVVADLPDASAAGPLVGVRAALAYAQSLGFSRLATAPCDAPFLPLDLVARLEAAMEANGAPAAVAETPRGLEPMFALWSVQARSAIDDECAHGEASPRAVLDRLGAARARFEERDDPFANVNRPADLAAAEARLKG